MRPTAFGWALFSAAFAAVAGIGVEVFAAAAAAETDAVLGGYAEPAPEPAPDPNPWRAGSITTYGPGYHGKRTATGERYDDRGWTVAAPVARDANGKPKRLQDGRYEPLVPFGSRIDLEWRGRQIRGLKVNDTCIGGTWDVTAKAMAQIYGRYEDTKLRGARWRLSK